MSVAMPTGPLIRTRFLFWAAVITIVAIILQTATQDVAMSVVARMLVGFGTSALGLSGPVYLAETLPFHCGEVRVWAYTRTVIMLVGAVERRTIVNAMLTTGEEASSLPALLTGLRRSTLPGPGGYHPPFKELLVFSALLSYLSSQNCLAGLHKGTAVRTRSLSLHRHTPVVTYRTQSSWSRSKKSSRRLSTRRMSERLCR